MNVNKVFLILVLFLVFIPCALGVEFTPQGNINLRSVYSIINGVDVNASYFYGDGSGLTGITSSTANYSTFANSSTYWDDETSQADLNVNSSTYWGSYDNYTDFQSLLSIAWSQITSKFITAVDNIYVYMSGTNLIFNETKLNATIDARSDFDTKWSIDGMWIYNNSGDLSFNTTSGDYRYLNVDGDTMTGNLAIETLLNPSLSIIATGINNPAIVYLTDSDSGTGWSVEAIGTGRLRIAEDSALVCYWKSGNYICSNNITATNFIGDLNGTADVATSWDGETSQGDLDVNSANYWDSLNSPSDIGSDDITDDGTWIVVGDEGNLNVNSSTYWDGETSQSNLNVNNSAYLEGTDFGTLTDAKWCVYDLAGTEIDCNVDPVSDTTYSAGSNLTLTGTTFSWNSSWVDTYFARFTELVGLLGNWSADKSSYSTTSEADLLYAPIAIEGTVTSVGTDDNYLTGGPITTTGTISFNETKMNATIAALDVDTTYSAGNGISLSGTTFSVAGNTGLSQDADGLSITDGGVGDTQIADAYINQALTTTSDVTFNNVTSDGYFIGDGSQLTGISAGGSWSDPVDSNIIPDTDDTYDLGNTTHKFKDIYIDDKAYIDYVYSNYWYPASDPNTFINIGLGDRIILEAGGIELLSVIETTQNTVIINEDGVDTDFRVESDTDANLFFTDGTGAGKVGIGTATPSEKLDVRGNINVSGYNVTVNCITFDSGGKICSGT